MNKITRLILIALALVTVLSFVSCGGGDNETPTNKGKTNETDEGEEAENYAPGLPDKRFPDGTEFTFAVRWMEGDNDYSWNINDIASEGLDGDQISNAAFERNSYIEDKYNVIVDIHQCGNCGTGLFGSPMSLFINQNAMTGDVPIDAIIASPYDTVGYAISGLIMDLETVEFLDLENEWWDQSALTDLRMGDRIFMVAGDVTVVDNKAVQIYSFNKQLAKNLSLPDLYETVSKNQWTLETLKTYSEMAYADLNDNGPDINDTYGFTFWQDQVYTFVTSSGLNFAEMDNNGIPRMSISDSKFIEGWEDIIDTITSTGMFDRTAYSITTSWKDDGSSVFNEGRALFAGLSVASIMKIKSVTDIDYGIIPAPLYTEEQDDYISTVACYGYAMLSIPVNENEKKLSDTGYILEAFSATSRQLMLPVFYDLVLQYRVAQAPQDAEMLDLIYSKIRYDIGNFMNFNDFTTQILTLFINHDKGISTWYAGAESAIKEEIKKVTKLFE